MQIVLDKIYFIQAPAMVKTKDKSSSMSQIIY